MAQVTQGAGQPEGDEHCSWAWRAGIAGPSGLETGSGGAIRPHRGGHNVPRAAVQLWPAKVCEVDTPTQPEGAPAPRCLALPARHAPAPRWTEAVKLDDPASIPRLLQKPLEDYLRISFHNHEKDENANDRRTPTTCAEYLALYDGGRTEYCGGRFLAGGGASILAVRCRTLALLAKAKPAQRSLGRTTPLVPCAE